MIIHRANLGNNFTHFTIWHAIIPNTILNNQLSKHMITISPFAALRPEVALAKAVASRPYDVLSSKEARTEAQGNPNTFYTSPKVKLIYPKQ